MIHLLLCPHFVPLSPSPMRLFAVTIRLELLLSWHEISNWRIWSSKQMPIHFQYYIFPIESSLIFRTSHTRHRQQMCKCIMNANRMQCNDQWFKINQKRNLWEWQYFSLVFSKFWRISVTSLGQQQLLLWFKIKRKDSSILDFILIFFRWLEIWEELTIDMGLSVFFVTATGISVTCDCDYGQNKMGSLKTLSVMVWEVRGGNMTRLLQR